MQWNKRWNKRNRQSSCEYLVNTREGTDGLSKQLSIYRPDYRESTLISSRPSKLDDMARKWNRLSILVFNQLASGCAHFHHYQYCDYSETEWIRRIRFLLMKIRKCNSICSSYFVKTFAFFHSIFIICNANCCWRFNFFQDQICLHFLRRIVLK